MKPYGDPSIEEILERVVLDERYGSGKASPGYAHCSGQDREIAMGVTREVRDKGAPEIRHGKRVTGWLDTANKMQAKQRTMFEIEIQEG